MSAAATFWAWNQDVKSSHKLTLLALANCHNEKSGRCNPSIATLAKMTGLNRKTILRSVAELKVLGLVVPTKKYGASNQHVLQTSTNLGTGTENQENKTSTKNGTKPVPKTDQSQKRTSPKNGPVPNLDITSTKFGHDQYQIWDTNLKEPKKNLKEYVFAGDVIKLNQSDFDKMINQYPCLNLITELNQLDIELRGEKKWFGTMNAKLNYRNKQAGRSNGSNQSTGRKRSHADNIREQAKRAIAEINARDPKAGDGIVCEDSDVVSEQSQQLPDP